MNTQIGCFLSFLPPGPGSCAWYPWVTQHTWPAPSWSHLCQQLSSPPFPREPTLGMAWPGSPAPALCKSRRPSLRHLAQVRSNAPTELLSASSLCPRSCFSVCFCFQIMRWHEICLHSSPMEPSGIEISRYFIHQKGKSFPHFLPMALGLHPLFCPFPSSPKPKPQETC